MREHYHTSIDSILLTALTVAIAFHAARWAAATAAKSSNPTAQTVGKAIGAVFAFP